MVSINEGMNVIDAHTIYMKIYVVNHIHGYDTGLLDSDFPLEYGTMGSRIEVPLTPTFGESTL